jgi:uncharacterized protein YbaA (DUF1428 family)
MTYIEGFVAAVPETNKAAYTKHASDAFPLFKEFGVSRMVETWESDVPDGKVTDFRRAVKARPDEKIVFSWFEYPSKAARDAANEKMMSDPRMAEAGKDMPFDGKRMIFGGFDTISDKGAPAGTGYVNGSLFAVPNANKSDFTAFAKQMADIFTEYGATRVLDAWGEDVPKGKVTDFQGAVQARDDETVVFGWIEWTSKDDCDSAWEKIMGDPRMAGAKMPCDGQRMVFGGFEPIVDLTA